LGPRRASLIQTLAPVFAALLQIPLLNEDISMVGVLGMVVTLGGVAWVISERAIEGEIRGSLRKGVVFAVIGAFCQGAGLILAKAGLGKADASSALPQLAGIEAIDGAATAGESISPIYGTLVRMLSAFVVLMAITAIMPKRGDIRRAFKDRKAISLTALGSFTGPFIGVSLSLYAVANTNTAVASTIMSTFPVLVIPMVFFFYGERTSPRAIVGALVAIGGVTILMFREQINALFSLPPA
ncbi:MAG: DMT family transporter, partial [Planctomycetes bacterium]|nr:DMT family transporter [Planctomycetota bacterium]